MKNPNRFVLALTVLLSLSLGSPWEGIAESIDHKSLRSMFQPLPESTLQLQDPRTRAQVELGKKLFKETRFSKDQTLSCNSCHQLDRYGVDNEPTSPGHLGQRGSRNSPTVYNAAIHFAQFWDGRAKDVEEQALGPILNPVEMAMTSDADVLERLKDDAAYRTLFAQAFPEETPKLTFQNIGRAIGAFERTLITPGRFDKYLKGDDSALTQEELAGMILFRDTGCVACHNGPALGGTMFQKLGVVKPYPTADMGRFEITKNEVDKFMFKVPSLRNIEKTAPYFHDGSVASLEAAVSLMAEHQLGRVLSPEQNKSIVLFLHALTGPLPKDAA